MGKDSIMMSLRSELMLKMDTHPSKVNVVAVNYDKDKHNTEAIKQMLDQHIIGIHKNKIMVTQELMQDLFSDGIVETEVTVPEDNNVNDNVPEESDHQVKESMIFLPIRKISPTIKYPRPYRPRKQGNESKKKDYKVIVIDPFKGGLSELLKKGEAQKFDDNEEAVKEMIKKENEKIRPHLGTDKIEIESEIDKE